MSLSSTQLTYPSTIVDGYFGQTITISLKKSQAVRKYLITFVPGTLSGGTSPQWAYSTSKPVITHIRIEADNEVLLDADTDLLLEMNYLNGFTSDGSVFQVNLADHNYRTGSFFDATAFPSFNYNDVRMYLTFNTLANITTGSPTGSSGSMIYLQEESIPRTVFQSSVSRNFMVKRLQTIVSLPLTGDNILTNLLPQTGAYKALLFKAMDSSGNPSDSVVSKISITLNDIYKLTESYWTMLKNQNKSLFKVAPDTGYSALVFQDDDKISKLVYLGDTQNIKSVITTITTTSSGGTLKVLRVFYVM